MDCTLMVPGRYPCIETVCFTLLTNFSNKDARKVQKGLTNTP